MGAVSGSDGPDPDAFRLDQVGVGTIVHVVIPPLAISDLAWEQIHHNIDLIRPGMGFDELSEKCWKLPQACRPNRYSAVVHGVGLCDEYPHVAYLEDRGHFGYDGVLQPGMTICVESYIGEHGGPEGVKLEEQVLITETGVEVISSFPFEDELLPRQAVEPALLVARPPG